MESLRDIVPLRTLEKHIQASCYNQVQLALHRLESPLSVELPKHAGLEIRLEADAWLCVDLVQVELPVLRWYGFEVHARRSLHEPIRCRLDLYHVRAGLVMGTALDDLETLLKRRLAEAGQVD